MIRQATIEYRTGVEAESERRRVEAYMYQNFRVELMGRFLLVTGTDNAGWTLGVQLDRLASGGIIGQEVTGARYPTNVEAEHLYDYGDYSPYGGPDEYTGVIPTTGAVFKLWGETDQVDINEDGSERLGRAYFLTIDGQEVSTDDLDLGF